MRRLLLVVLIAIPACGQRVPSASECMNLVNANAIAGRYSRGQYAVAKGVCKDLQLAEDKESFAERYATWKAIQQAKEAAGDIP